MMNARYGEKAERRTYRPSAFDRFTTTVMGILAYVVLPALGILLVLLLLWMVVGSVVFGIEPNSSPVSTVTHGKLELPNCKEEDSDNCIWNAHSSGNGEGVSFIAYHGKVYYLDGE